MLRTCQKSQVNNLLHSLFNLNFAEIENPLLVLCVATYGEGDPTDNAQSLFEFISNNENDFSGLSYAVSSLSY
jgi:sulfite reductase alpha subunit-like flavoprotein